MRPAVFALITVVAVSTTRLHAGLIHDNGGPATDNGLNFGNKVVDDFQLSQSVSITSITAWMFTESDAASLGEIGWGIWSTTGTAPESLLYSGMDSSALTTATALSVGPYDIFKVDIDTGAVALGPGSFWLQLNNGALFTDGTDPTWSGWMFTPSGVTGQSAMWDGDETLMTWDNLSPPAGRDNAFRLNGEFTGQHVPEPTSLALLGIGAAGLIAVRRRRKLAASAP